MIAKGRIGQFGLSNEIELILHFVNRERDPSKLPEVKRYILKTDSHTKAFLA